MSIMVGVLVLAVVAGVVFASVFMVIPWAQDNATQQQLRAVQTAESIYYVSATPSSYADLSELQAPTSFALGSGGGHAGTLSMSVEASGTPLLPRGTTPLAVDATATSYIAAAVSPTRTTFYVIQGSAQIYTSATLPSPLPNGLAVPAAPTISGSLPNGAVGSAYSQTIPSTDAASFATTSGTLPNGLALDQASGVISGTPTQPGTSTFVVTATNGLGTAQHSFTIDVVALGQMAFSWNAGLPGCQSAQLPMGGAVTATIDWGDGTAPAAVSSAAPTHTYADTAPHSVRITGSFASWTNSSQDCITAVTAWHDTHTTDITSGFESATNLTVFTELPSSVTNASSAFNMSSLNDPAVSNWDVSHITNMASMFSLDVAFNQPLNNWDVSHVTDMSRMFQDDNFNQPLNNWDVSNVTNTLGMFYSATAFDQPLSSWDVSHVTEMGNMFYLASAFNQPLNSWDVSSVTDMTGVFKQASAFNQPLNNWNTANVTNMSMMFYEATAFNQPLNSWDTGKVTTMRSLFYGSSAFDQGLSNWNTAKVTDMSYMLNSAASFDQDLSGWNVSGVLSNNYFSTGSRLTAPHTPHFS